MSHGKRLTPELAPDEVLSYADIASFLAPYKRTINALPFFIFVSEAALATACSFIYADTDPLLKLIFSQLLAINATMSGLLHFFPPLFDFYTSMIFVPFPRFWLYSTGLGLLVAGPALVLATTQRYAAWSLVALFVLMFPGNLACVVMERPRKLVTGGSVAAALLRLPLQFLFIWWAFWFTSEPLHLPLNGAL